MKIEYVLVEYSFIRPLKKLEGPQLMSNCYAKHWKKRSTLEVGHRGLGNSYTKYHTFNYYFFIQNIK